MPGKCGYVYVLSSPKSEYVKIGGTDYPPLKRIRQINSVEPYKSLGPWSLADFRQVNDWRSVESFLHYCFRGCLIDHIDGQKELFRLPVRAVSEKLSSLDETLITKKPKIDRMFQDEMLSGYLIRLFQFTGMMNWLDIQGAWTFTLFPGTNGGRYFTLNIGSHEVAFSTLPRPDDRSVIHLLVMDRLILDFADVVMWVKSHGGSIDPDRYATALPRSTSVWYSGSFETALEFMELDGVRRALIAYWNEALVGLKERGAQSVFGRHHNWNAIAELRMRMAML